MMVKNQTDHEVWTGGAAVPPDGEFHQVKDDDGTREALRAGVLTQKREQRGKGKGDSGDPDGEGEGGEQPPEVLGDDNTTQGGNDS